MNNPHIARALALRNGLEARLERERRTLIDMGYSPDLIAAIIDTPKVHRAIFAQRQYLAKNWAAGAYRRAHDARNVEPIPAPKAGQTVQPSRQSFDGIFRAAA